MNTSSIRSSAHALVEVEAQQATIKKVTTDLGAGKGDVSAYELDGSLTAKENAAAAPVSAETTFDQGKVDLSSFLKHFKAGDKIHLDGPLTANYDGSITKLDRNTMAMSIKGKGTVTLTRKTGDTFILDVQVGKKPFKMEMTAKVYDNKLVLTNKWNKDEKLYFTRDGAMINLDPDGMSMPGSFDMSKVSK